MMRLSFACKNIDFQELVMCSFELNKTEYGLFTFLLSQDEPLCTTTIGEQSGKDRTTIQKAVKKLVAKGLVNKHQVNLESGGYTFVYSIKNKEYIKSTMLDIVNKWHDAVIDQIKSW
ncbi:MAG: helix-turn-helix domain-containing protein [Candidatus Woesearchaeota archaeon]